MGFIDTLQWWEQVGKYLSGAWETAEEASEARDMEEGGWGVEGRTGHD